VGSSYALLASGLFFIAVGVAAIVVEQRWPGGILSILVAAPLIVVAIKGLAADDSDAEDA